MVLGIIASNFKLLVLMDFQCCGRLRMNYDELGLLNFITVHPVGIYLLKVNNRNSRARCEICSKLAIRTPERRQ